MDRTLQYLERDRASKDTPIICILDCCRSKITAEDNNCANLANIDTKHTNVFFLYSTLVNQTALDGVDGNSPFTSSLLKHMDVEDDITKIAIAIRHDLMDKGQVFITPFFNFFSFRVLHTLHF